MKIKFTETDFGIPNIGLVHPYGINGALKNGHILESRFPKEKQSKLLSFTKEN